jgi:hypothetical protein
MKLLLVSKESVKKLSNQELISLHRRVHQLIVLKNKQSVDLKKVHDILVQEIVRRKLKHYSNIS